MKTLKESILELRKNGKTYNEIREELKCSKSTISYYCKNYSLDKKIVDIDSVKEFFSNATMIETLNRFKITRNKLVKIIGENKKLKCTYCNNEFETSVSSTQKYCSDKCKKDFRNEKLKSKNYNYDKLKIWRTDKKIKCVEYKGGSCVICGYNKCYSSLHFHHLDSNEKDFSISNIDRSFEKVKAELDKCILVCSNCHGEIHEGLIKV